MENALTVPVGDGKRIDLITYSLVLTVVITIEIINLISKKIFGKELWR